VELDEAESFYAQISLLDGGSQCLQEKLDQTKANMTALELGLRKAVKEVNAYKIRLQNSFKKSYPKPSWMWKDQGKCWQKNIAIPVWEVSAVCDVCSTLAPSQYLA
jgi:hypothetical protein